MAFETRKVMRVAVGPGGLRSATRRDREGLEAPIPPALNRGCFQRNLRARPQGALVEVQLPKEVTL